MSAAAVKFRYDFSRHFDRAGQRLAAAQLAADLEDCHCDHAGGLCRQDVGAECDTPPLVRITHPECFR